MYLSTIIYDLGSITDWLTAIGTISAVIVALYLSRRDTKPKAKVSTSFSYLVYLYGVDDSPEFLTVGIVNQGLVPIHLKECTISMGRKNRAAFPDGSHNVDRLLKPGEYYEHRLNYEQILNGIRHYNITKFKTYAYFQDASGRKYKSKKIIIRI
ncbi:hypothetical protein NSQ14_11855 [Caldifermentibacillus hisashii]|uniref:hypothetical protein n=1 Tax=Caldifermentibacillus hisashii TaxID=996558 RepID=UPI0031FE116A